MSMCKIVVGIDVGYHYPVETTSFRKLNANPLACEWGLKQRG